MFKSFCIPSHETFNFNKFKDHSGSSSVTLIELVSVKAMQSVVFRMAHAWHPCFLY